MKKKSKIILLSVLVLVLILISLIAILANNSHTVVGVKNYYKISSENSDYIHFSLDDFGNYKNLYFQSNRIHSLMSDSYGSMFIAEYDKNNFNDQLLRLESFEYQTDVILDSDEYIIPQTSFSIGDWNFKVLKPQSQTQEFPKNIDFVCINISECKIGYMTFYDEDIDYLCKSGNENEYMKHFVKKYFKYNFNRTMWILWNYRKYSLKLNFISKGIIDVSAGFQAGMKYKEDDKWLLALYWFLCSC